MSARGIHTDPKKVEAVKNFKFNSIKSIRSFLGLSGFYRKFIKDFAKITKPLRDFLKKGVKFHTQWKKTQAVTQQAIDTLKNLMTRKHLDAMTQYQALYINRKFEN